MTGGGTVRWEDPPSSGSGPVHDWAAIAAELSARPGEWAIVVVAANAALAGSTARHIRNGYYLPLRAIGRFEAVSRTVDGEYRVYARFPVVGGGS